MWPRIRELQLRACLIEPAPCLIHHRLVRPCVDDKEQIGGDRWQRLSSTFATLLNIQFAGEWPLLRTSALQALPANLRATVIGRSNRMALRFAGTLVDGIGEGSIRPVDPLIASQIIMATLNAAYDIRGWATKLSRDRAIALYASTLAHGLFDDATNSLPNSSD
jgi:hypothetical protein